MTFQAERLAKAIKERRLKLNMSEADLASAAGVSQSYVFKLEKVKLPRPGVEGLLKLADALRYPGIEGLLIGEGELPPPDDKEGSVEAVIEQLRREVAHLAQSSKSVPMYQWGTAGDPREGSAEPVGYQQIPPGREALVGPRGFAVRVRGDSMMRRNIRDGDVVFINPDRPWGMGSLVLARVETNDETGMVVKEVAMDGQGHTILRSALASGAGVPVSGSQYAVIGPVVLKVSVDEFVNGHAATGAA